MQPKRIMMKGVGFVLLLAAMLPSGVALAMPPAGGPSKAADAAQVRQAATTRTAASPRDAASSASSASSAKKDAARPTPKTPHEQRAARRAERLKNFKAGMAGLGIMMTPFAVFGSLGAGAMIGDHQNLVENRTLDRVPYVQLENAPAGSMDAKFNTLANFPRVSPKVRDHEDYSAEARAGFDKLSTTLLDPRSDLAHASNYPQYLSQAIHSGESLASDIHARADRTHTSADTSKIDAAVQALKQRQNQVNANPTLSNPNPGNLPGPATLPLGAPR